MQKLPLVLLQYIVPHCDPVAARTLVHVAQSNFHRNHVFYLQKTWLKINSAVWVIDSLLSRSDYITLFEFATAIEYPIYWTLAKNEDVFQQVATLFSTHPHLFYLFSNSQMDVSPFFNDIENCIEIYDWQAALFSFSKITNLADAYRLNFCQRKLKYGDRFWKRPWTQRQQERISGWHEWLQIQINYHRTEYFLLRSTLMRARMNYVVRLLEINIPGDWEYRNNQDVQEERILENLERVYQQREKDLDNFQEFILLCPCLHTMLNAI